MTRVYYKQAAACVIVFDVTKRLSFAEVLRWKADLDDKVRQPSGDPLPCLLLANKADLPDRPVPAAEIDEFVRGHGSRVGPAAWDHIAASSPNDSHTHRLFRVGGSLGQDQRQRQRGHSVRG